MQQATLQPPEQETRAETAARLWLSEQQWFSLLERIERDAREHQLHHPHNPHDPPQPYQGPERRDQRQTRHPVNLICVLRVQGPDGAAATYQLPARDLSSGGMGFYAPHPLPKNARCTAAFRGEDGRGLIAAGRIAWTSRQDERLYRVGLCFEEPLDVEACLDPHAPRGA